MVSGCTLPFGWLPALWAWNLPAPSLFKMASAMIERAELPVQRNSTSNRRSLTPPSPCASCCHLFSLGGAGGTTCGGRTGVRHALAAVLGEVAEQRVHGLEPRRIDHRAARAPHRHQARRPEAVEMKCESIGRQAERGRDLTGSE